MKQVLMKAYQQYYLVIIYHLINSVEVKAGIGLARYLLLAMLMYLYCYIFLFIIIKVTRGICSGLKCYTEDIFGTSIFAFCHNSGVPVDGTICDDNHHCQLGSCVSKKV